MAKIELKGVIKSVSPVSLIAEKGTKKQTVILFIPGWRDEYGEKKGQDEEWPLEVIGEKVDKLNLSDATHFKQKAKCVVYVTGRSYTKDDKTMYFIGANLAEVELMGAATRTSAPALMPVGSDVDLTSKADDDDLPF